MSSRSTRHAERKAKRRVAQFEARNRRLLRLRSFIGFLGVALLAVSVGCAVLPLPLVCEVPRDWYLALWAALFGSFLGLTIRLFLERRRHERGTT